MKKHLKTLVMMACISAIIGYGSAEIINYGRFSCTDVPFGDLTEGTPSAVNVGFMTACSGVYLEVDTTNTTDYKTLISLEMRFCSGNETIYNQNMDTIVASINNQSSYMFTKFPYPQSLRGLCDTVPHPNLNCTGQQPTGDLAYYKTYYDHVERRDEAFTSGDWTHIQLDVFHPGLNSDGLYFEEIISLLEDNQSIYMIALYGMGFFGRQSTGSYGTNNFNWLDPLQPQNIKPAGLSYTGEPAAASYVRFRPGDNLYTYHDSEHLFNVCEPYTVTTSTTTTTTTSTTTTLLGDVGCPDEGIYEYDVTVNLTTRYSPRNQLVAAIYPSTCIIIDAEDRLSYSHTCIDGHMYQEVLENAPLDEDYIYRQTGTTDMPYMYIGVYNKVTQKWAYPLWEKTIEEVTEDDSVYSVEETQLNNTICVMFEDGQTNQYINGVDYQLQLNYPGDVRVLVNSDSEYMDCYNITGYGQDMVLSASKEGYQTYTNHDLATKHMPGASPYVFRINPGDPGLENYLNLTVSINDGVDTITHGRVTVNYQYGGLSRTLGPRDINNGLYRFSFPENSVYSVHLQASGYRTSTRGPYTLAAATLQNYTMQEDTSEVSTITTLYSAVEPGPKPIVVPLSCTLESSQCPDKSFTINPGMQQAVNYMEGCGYTWCCQASGWYGRTCQPNTEQTQQEMRILPLPSVGQHDCIRQGRVRLLYRNGTTTYVSGNVLLLDQDGSIMGTSHSTPQNPFIFEVECDKSHSICYRYGEQETCSKFTVKSRGVEGDVLYGDIIVEETQYDTRQNVRWFHFIISSLYMIGPFMFLSIFMFGLLVLVKIMREF